MCKENMDIKEQIHKWLSKTIIDLNLCPFAKNPFNAGQINIRVSQAQTMQHAYQDFVSELEQLNSTSSFTTSLISFHLLGLGFEDFNDFCGSLDDTLINANLDHTFQLVCFHPEFKFENLKQSDKANYVNRSPVPLIHILYKEQVRQAIDSIKDAQNISLNNEKIINSLSKAQLKDYFWYM